MQGAPPRFREFAPRSTIYTTPILAIEPQTEKEVSAFQYSLQLLEAVRHQSRQTASA